MKKYIAPTSRFLASLLLLSVVTGCSPAPTPIPFPEPEPEPVTDVPPVEDPLPEELREEDCMAVTDFSVRLFQKSLQTGENTLLSPLSVLMALAMTSGGAQGETLSQMETVFGLSAEALHPWVHAYRSQLPQSDTAHLLPANSIWFTDNPAFHIREDFLQNSAQYYDAELFQIAMDKAAAGSINDWVKEHTDGMIPEILDDVSEDAVMYLVNALAFEAEWMDIYHDYQIDDAVFTTADGQERTVSMMHSDESLYLQDERATGFIKYYAGGSYAFAALLPEEGLSAQDYAASLTGEHLQELLQTSGYGTVYASLPKFDVSYETEMSGLLASMGMTDAFSADAADFSALGTMDTGENLYINRVLHKTRLTLDERGTKAGASTVVEMMPETALPDETEPYVVVLDRPFVYMLLDVSNNIPFFIGILEDPEA